MFSHIFPHGRVYSTQRWKEKYTEIQFNYFHKPFELIHDLHHIIVYNRLFKSDQSSRNYHWEKRFGKQRRGRSHNSAPLAQEYIWTTDKEWKPSYGIRHIYFYYKRLASFGRILQDIKHNTTEPKLKLCSQWNRKRNILPCSTGELWGVFYSFGGKVPRDIENVIY